MKKVTRKLKQILSISLVAAMVITMVPQNTMTVSATELETVEETSTEIIDETVETAEPVDTAPEESGEVPSEETPSEETPSEETPSEETPSEETPSEETPSEETLSEETPSEEAPGEETSKEAGDDETEGGEAVTGDVMEDPAAEETDPMEVPEETEEDSLPKGVLGAYGAEDGKTDLATAASVTLTLEGLDSGNDVVYTGAELKPVVKITAGDATLVENTDYIVAYKRGSEATTDFTNIGTITVEITAKEDSTKYTGSTTASYTITALDLSQLTAENVTLSADSLKYTGEELKPTLASLTVAGKTISTLTQGTDYDLLYKNNVNIAAGDRKGQKMQPTVIVRGMSKNVTGSINKTFKITKGDAPAQVTTSRKVDAEGEFVWLDLSKITGIFDPEKYGTPLYTVESANIRQDKEVIDLNSVMVAGFGNELWFTGLEGDAGDTAEITVTAAFANYEDSSVKVTVTRVSKIDIWDANVELMIGDTLITNQTCPVYTGTEIKPEVTKVTVEVKNEDGTPATTEDGAPKTVTVPPEAYEVTYSDNLNVGRAVVDVTAKGDSDYKGIISRIFWIEPLDLTGAEVTLSDDALAYTGEELKPTLASLTVGGKAVTLQESDYELTYKNNVNVPAAGAQDADKPTVTVKAKGDNVTGSVSKTFTITKADAPALKKDAPTFHAVKNTAEEFEVALADYFATPSGETPEYSVENVSDASSILGSYDTDKYKLEEGVLSFKTAGTGTKGQSATMTVKAAYKNYEEQTMVVTVTLEDKIWLTIIGVSISEKIYDGELIKADTSAVVAKDSKGNDHTADAGLTYKYISEGGYDSETAPTDAGTYKLIVSVSDTNNTYTGSVEIPFEIGKATVTVTASDAAIEAGREVPETTALDYIVTGLVKDDAFQTPPVLEYQKNGVRVEKSNIDNNEPASYDIVAKGAAFSAEVGKNYGPIVYMPGTFTIKEVNGYNVTFNLNYIEDESESEPETVKVNAGGLIAENMIPEASREGYSLKGWYKDAACTKAWNFGTDTVQADIILYALWIKAAAADDAEGAGLMIQEIPNQTYTGKAIKPAVKVYDGDALLTAKNYTITYKNNTNVDAVEAVGGISSTVETVEGGFNAALPYIIIKGKGNYKETIYMNFHIKKASLENPGVTLKYNDQLTKSTKTQKPVSSLKYKKAMKEGVDYTVTVSGDCEAGEEDTGEFKVTTKTELMDNKTKVTPALIPANAVGTVTLTITGIGNYTGTMEKKIKIAKKAELLKNAKISLGSTSRAFAGEEVTFNAAYVSGGKTYSVADDEVLVGGAKRTAYTVTLDGKPLKEGTDFEVEYADNTNVGTATLTITGREDDGAVYCVGTKSVTFKITGTKFTAVNPGNPKPGTIQVEGLVESVPYTGFPQVQNDVKLSVVPAEDEEATELVYGEDYTITYKNNVKKGKATMTFTATPASGFTGSFKKTFKIDAVELKDAVSEAKAAIPGYTSISFADNNATEFTIVSKGGEEVVDLSKENDAFTGTIATACAYTPAGVAPKIMLTNKDGTLLKEKTDYTVKYSNNKKVAGSDAAQAPTITINGKGGYKGKVTIKYSIINNSIKGLKAEVTPVQFKANNKAAAPYKPKVKVTCNGKALGAKEYKVTYQNNTQTEVSEYLTAKKNNAQLPEAPTATIEMKDTSSYYQTGKGWTDAQTKTANKIVVDLGDQFYDTKLNGQKVKIDFDQSSAAATYTGEQVRPRVRQVLYDRTLLQENTDYTVSYGKNNTAGRNKGTITIKGTGFYSGSVTVKFTILSKAIYSKKIDLADTELVSTYLQTMTDDHCTQVYENDEWKYYYVVAQDYDFSQGVKPEVCVFSPAEEEEKWYNMLKENRDYTLAYANNTAVGNATVTITGKGNYTGSVTIPFTIVKGKDINDCDIKLYADGELMQKNEDGAYVMKTYTYNLAAVIKDGEKTLQEYDAVYGDGDYSYESSMVGNKGTLTIKATSKDYYGSITYDIVVLESISGNDL